MKLTRFQAVEIPVAQNSTLVQYNFPDQQNLRNAEITAIEIYTSETLAKSPVTGSNLISVADLQKTSLLLYQGDVQLTYYLPVLALNRYQGGSAFTAPFVRALFELDNVVISWTKSLVQLASAPASVAGAPAVFAFGIYYELPKGL
jgi:hypothetical protein